jgi:hypothetical protein
MSYVVAICKNSLGLYKTGMADEGAVGLASPLSANPNLT